MEEIKIAIKIDDTQLDSATKKANKLKTLLEEVGVLIRSLGSVTNNYVTTNHNHEN